MGNRAPSARPLVERDAELERLTGFVDAAREGRGAMALIEGPPGIGKTRLLEAARDLAAERGLELLSARGGDLERGLPFGVARQLFERRLRLGDREMLDAWLEGPAATGAAVLLESEDPKGRAPDSHAVLNGLYWLVSNLAERGPLCIAVDDAHWSDPASLGFLHYLARRIEDLPVALVLTMRTADAETRDEIVNRLRTEPSAFALRPEPLSSVAVASLVRERLADDAATEFCQACHRASGGNPFLVGELIAELRADGVAPVTAEASAVARLVPDGVGRSVLARLARLPPEAVRLAEAVATLGDGAELEAAAKLAGLDQRGADAADALIEAQLLGPGPRLEFVHPLVREAIYGELPSGERARAHANAAALLREAGGPADRIAAQLIAAPAAAEPWATDVLQAAARDALRRGAPEMAVAYLRRAVEEVPAGEQQADVLRALGVAEVQVRAEEGIGDLRSALELNERDPDRRAEIACELALALVQFARLPEAVEVLRAELAQAATVPGEPRLRLEAEFASTALFANEPPLAELDARLAGIADAASPASRAGRAIMASRALRSLQRADDAARAAKLAQAVLEHGLLDDLGPGSTLHFGAIATLICCDRLGAAQQWAQEGLRSARLRGDPFGLGFSTSLLSWVAYARGAIAEVEVMSSQAVWLAREHELTIGLPAFSSTLVDALVARGEATRAWEELDRDGLTGDPPPVFTSAWLLQSRGRLRALDGDHEGALSDLEAAGESLRRWGAVGPGISTWRADAVDSLLALERRDDARALAAEDLVLARKFGAPRALGLALRARARTVHGEEQLDGLEEAAGSLGKAEALLEQGRTLCDLGAGLRRAGQRKRAREPLRRARELAHACAARPLADRARQELVASGARPRRIATIGADALTPSERRVADLAAEGLTNREIAQSLFLSLRTVEMHLTRAYRKLEIGSRSELPGALESKQHGK